MKNNNSSEVTKKKKTIRKSGIKKYIIFLLHIMFLVVLVTGVANMMRSPNFTKGFLWANAKNYEDSEVFVFDFMEETDLLFDFIFLKNIFETDGIFDEGKSLFVIEKNQGMSEEYTVADVMDLSKNLGIFFDDNFQIRFSESARQNRTFLERDMDKKYLVSWKSYGNTFFDEVVPVNMSISELVTESMEYLGRYYLVKKHTDLHQSNLRYRMTFGERIDTNDESFVYDKLKEFGRYAAVNSEYPVIETNLPEIPDNLKYLADATAEITGTSYQVLIAIDTTYPVQDVFSKNSQNYTVDREQYSKGMYLLICGFLGMLTTFGFLVCLCGTVLGNKSAMDIVMMDKLGIEIIFMLTFLLSTLLQYLGRNTLDKMFELLFFGISRMQAKAIVTGIIAYLCMLIMIFSFVRSLKAGVLYENSLLKRLIDGFGIFKKGEKYTWGAARNYLIFCTLNLGLAFLASRIYYTTESLAERSLFVLCIFFIVAVNVIFFNRVYQNVQQRERISELVHQMSEGDLNFLIDVENFSGREAEMAKNLNNIRQGLQKSISEQVRSERMKADLITNVSHDLRTPLTNIVSYIGLIRKENPTQPKILEHIQTIENSAQRLKNLTDDLLEASRAASGSIKLEIGDIDIVSLVKQTNGEFEEKYEERKLEIVSDLPKESLIIRADGRRLWRVLENLYNNAYKYALAGSRIYVNMVKKEDQVVFTIKNISQAALNIKPEELTERFVRGDVSRSTAGHGLGLSIARSLTELQNGKFDISIDGDLFKATLIFPLSMDLDVQKGLGIDKAK